MSEEQNIEDQSTEDTQLPIEENSQSLSDVQPQTTNQELQTENMEVHKHPHHVTHKKKWGEYLLEFLMLFLAVFLGFIAENLRENGVEKEREKQYMQSLLSDLSSDTLNFNIINPLKEARINAIDSVFIFFNAHPDAKTISGKLFRTIRRTTYDRRFTRNTITINQLKNAGGMRLVQKKQVADSISSYDLLVEQANLYFDFNSANSQFGNQKLEKFITAADLLPLYISNPTRAIVNNIPDSLVIRINNTLLNEELNFMMQIKILARQEIELYTDLKQRAKTLMELIKKEYHLE